MNHHSYFYNIINNSFCQDNNLIYARLIQIFNTKSLKWLFIMHVSLRRYSFSPFLHPLTIFLIFFLPPFLVSPEVIIPWNFVSSKMFTAKFVQLSFCYIRPFLNNDIRFYSFSPIRIRNTSHSSF